MPSIPEGERQWDGLPAIEKFCCFVIDVNTAIIPRCGYSKLPIFELADCFEPYRNKRDRAGYFC